MKSEDEFEVTLGFTDHVDVTIPARPLNEWERRVTDRLLSIEFPGWEAWRSQLSAARVIRVCKDCPSVEFVIDTQATRPITHEGGEPVVGVAPASIEGHDVDGAEYEILLHVSAGWITELDVYRDDSKGFVAWPGGDDGEVRDISERLHMPAT